MGAYKTWVCDWCLIEARSEDDDYAPKSWDEIDGQLLCHACRACRSQAIALVRSDRHEINKGKRDRD